MRTFVWVALLIYTAVISLVLSSPIAFQKAVSIVEVRKLPSLGGGGVAWDVEPFVRGIPPPPNTKIVWEVMPEKKYIRTILGGAGNCSSLSFGAAYKMLKSNIDFQIVHILLPETFTKGWAHTILFSKIRHNGREERALVDLLFGGLPRSGNRLLELDDIRHGPVQGFSFEHLNDRKIDASSYYGDYLKGAVVGVRTATDVKEYFHFISSIHVDLKSARLEKYIFDGLAVLFGKYPPTYVESRAALGAPRGYWITYLIVLWLLRLFPGVVCFILAAYMKGMLKGRPSLE